jgi:hypothetical protein
LFYVQTHSKFFSTEARKSIFLHEFEYLISFLPFECKLGLSFVRFVDMVWKRKCQKLSKQTTKKCPIQGSDVFGLVLVSPRLDWLHCKVVCRLERFFKFQENIFIIKTRRALHGVVNFYNAGAVTQGPILRLVNLQQQRQRCSSLHRAF